MSPYYDAGTLEDARDSREDSQHEESNSSATCIMCAPDMHTPGSSADHSICERSAIRTTALACSTSLNDESDANSAASRFPTGGLANELCWRIPVGFLSALGIMALLSLGYLAICDPSRLFEG
ncbi:hypothetical protein LTR37_010486 [Vermiconidia calcicola]|uniref:Uncharacterized protein n=1 Tax=Vermiconidia calcicola TaxID=1690605 RepID=A0ACC3N4P0_9PEZI|nr:hypothetical protein LTR37_010486 [Vermiconidia calcicola]